MIDRLPTHLLVSALLKRVNDAGGIGVVLAKGDAQAGSVLSMITTASGSARAIEREIDFDGRAVLIDSRPSDSPDDYWRRRRARDPDLWVIALDSPQAERFIAETIGDH